jgi:hypothetical protein
VCAGKGKSGCASWCNRFTGFLDACSACSASSARRESDETERDLVIYLGPTRQLDNSTCESWCNQFSCAAPQCKSCDKCADKGTSGCASWCNQFTGFLPACSACSASSTRRESDETHKTKLGPRELEESTCAEFCN